MKKYTPPRKEFFMLPNNIFDMPLDVYAFKIYAYLVCCAGSRGECWPSLQKMSSKLGIAMSTVQGRISLLEKRKLISIHKHSGSGKYKNNVYTLLSIDNPEIYRDLDEPEELPMYISWDGRIPFCRAVTNKTKKTNTNCPELSTLERLLVFCEHARLFRGKLLGKESTPPPFSFSGLPPF